MSVLMYLDAAACLLVAGAFFALFFYTGRGSGLMGLMSINGEFGGWIWGVVWMSGIGLVWVVSGAFPADIRKDIALAAAIGNILFNILGAVIKPRAKHARTLPGPTGTR